MLMTSYFEPYLCYKLQGCDVRVQISKSVCTYLLGHELHDQATSVASDGIIIMPIIGTVAEQSAATLHVVGSIPGSGEVLLVFFMLGHSQ